MYLPTKRNYGSNKTVYRRSTPVRAITTSNTKYYRRYAILYENASDPQTPEGVGTLKFHRRKTNGNDRKRAHDDDDDETPTVTARRSDVTTTNGARTSDCREKSVRTGWPALSGGPDHDNV